MRSNAAALLGFALSSAGCFGGDNAIACDFRIESQRCQERSGVQAANPPAYQATCAAANGAYLDQACPRENVVGGCQIGPDVIDWYYAPMTFAEVEDRCDDDEMVLTP